MSYATYIPSKPISSKLLDRKLHADFLKGAGPLIEELKQFNAVKDELFPVAVSTKQKADLLVHHIEQGNFEDKCAEENDLQSDLDVLLTKLGSMQNMRTKGSVPSALTSVVSYKCFIQFLESGRILSRSETKEFSDTEFLLGVLHMCNILRRYSLRQGTVGDYKSVICCKDLATDLQDELLQFDFRNGNVRKSYDSLKYVVRNCEDILYDLSISTNKAMELPKPESLEGVPKRLNSNDFEVMNQNMKKFDEEREHVIVTSRTINNLGKKSIYACHRQDLKTAQKKLEEGYKMANELIDKYRGHPVYSELANQGALNQALEELCEGTIYLEWLNEDQTKVWSREAIKEKYGVMIPALTYLGGLVDFTGEVGRWAVTEATKRNTENVEKAFAVTSVAQDVFFQLGDAGLKNGSMEKKTATLLNNLKKLERILYDLAIKRGESNRNKRKLEDLQN